MTWDERRGQIVQILLADPAPGDRPMTLDEFKEASRVLDALVPQRCSTVLGWDGFRVHRCALLPGHGGDHALKMPAETWE